MSEQPAPYRPNATLKRVENGLESVLFNSRWLMAPFYLGLVICLGNVVQILQEAVGVHPQRSFRQ
jgi:uncharacterized membrane protein YqhA